MNWFPLKWIFSVLGITRIIDYDISYFIYTRNNPNIASTILNDINITKPIKFIVPGWLQTAKDNAYIVLKDAYLSQYDCVVVVLDWSKYNKEYLSTVVFTKEIGTSVGTILHNLFRSQPMTNLHLIGHSIGAHFCGFMSKSISSLSSGMQVIGRITGLDPALPGFSVFIPSERLNSNDALMVDIVHSDSWRLSIGEPIGKVDFYPNGGFAPQPGCTNIPLDIWITLQGDLDGIFCSHSKCRSYFRQSINVTSITARECDSWVKYRSGFCNNNKLIVFGENVPLTARGTFFFEIVTDSAY